MLRGVPGKILVEEDSREEVLILHPTKLYLSRGWDLYLTIDETIQYVTEKRLTEAVEELKAERAVAMVLIYKMENFSPWPVIQPMILIFMQHSK
jgi:cell division protein FtsI/penicillin-binding protein 2